MNLKGFSRRVIVEMIFAGIILSLPAFAQRGQRGPTVTSPEVTADGSVTFRIVAPQAQAVRLTARRIGIFERGPEVVSRVIGSENSRPRRRIGSLMW
jgi:hypothetical protein